MKPSAGEIRRAIQSIYPGADINVVDGEVVDWGDLEPLSKVQIERSLKEINRVRKIRRRRDELIDRLIVETGLPRDYLQILGINTALKKSFGYELRDEEIEGSLLLIRLGDRIEKILSIAQDAIDQDISVNEVNFNGE